MVKGDFMSAPCAQAVGAKLSGVKLVIIDEISMIDLATLYEISLRHSKSMGTVITDKLERSNKECLYFGGILYFTYYLQAIFIS